MDEGFKIYVEQLRDGHSEKIVEKFSPDFMDVHEEDLAFTDPVEVKGEAYLADDELMLHVDMATIATIPCAICNELVKENVIIQGFYHAVPLKEIKTGIFNFQDVIRENILLETPGFVECHEGQCPQREVLEKYFKKESEDSREDSDEKYRPFADLDFDQTNEKLK